MAVKTRPIRKSTRRVDPEGLLVFTWSDAEGSTHAAVADPDGIDAFEAAVRRRAESRELQRIILAGRPDYDRHTELKFRLPRGCVYFTDIARIGGRITGQDGTFYAPDEQPNRVIVLHDTLTVHYYGRVDEPDPRRVVPYPADLPAHLVSVRTDDIC